MKIIQKVELQLDKEQVTELIKEALDARGYKAEDVKWWLAMNIPSWPNDGAPTCEFKGITVLATEHGKEKVNS